MLGVVSGSKLFRSRKNRTVRKLILEIEIQLLFNENRMIISIKKSTFDLPWNYLKLSKYKLSLLIINLKPPSKLRIFQWAGKLGSWG